MVIEVKNNLLLFRLALAIVHIFFFINYRKLLSNRKIAANAFTVIFLKVFFFNVNGILSTQNHTLTPLLTGATANVHLSFATYII